MQKLTSYKSALKVDKPFFNSVDSGDSANVVPTTIAIKSNEAVKETNKISDHPISKISPNDVKTIKLN